MNPETLLAVFLGGAAYAGVGLLKSVAGGERFDWLKLLKTLLLAGLLAALNMVLGSGDLSEVEALVGGAGETVLLDKLLKAMARILRRLMAERWLG